MQTIQVNGQAHPLAGVATIADLITLLNVRGRYAVELNTSIVPRSRHRSQRLQAGDKVEIVAAVGGG